MVTNEADVAAFSAYTAEVEETATAPEPTPEPTPAPTPVEPTPAPEPTVVAPAPTREDGERVFASPLARKRATELGIDIVEVPGTGLHGRIIEQNVLEFTPTPTVATPAPVAESVTPAADAPAAEPTV